MSALRHNQRKPIRGIAGGTDGYARSGQVPPAVTTGSFVNDAQAAPLRLERALHHLSAAIPGLVDPRASAVRKHDLERVLARLADDKGAHLKRAAEKPGMSQAGIGNIVFDGSITVHRDAVACGAFPVQNNGVIVNLSRAIFIDEQYPTLLPAPNVRAPPPVARFAHIDAMAMLDRLAPRKIECIGNEMSMVRQLLSGYPIAVSGEGSRQQHTENNQSDHDLDKRDATSHVAPIPAAESSCLHARLPGLRSANEGSRVSQIVVGTPWRVHPPSA